MDELFQHSEQEPQPQREERANALAADAERGRSRRPAVIAALLFLAPLLGIVALALFARRIAPAHKQHRAGVVADERRAADVPPVPPARATVSELIEYRDTLRSRGDFTDFANIRLWAAAAAEPSLLFAISPPRSGAWRWSVSQCGTHVLAIERTESLLREVALFCIADEQWVWRKTLPWPDVYEDPWIFGGHLVLRSSKNGRRFAMEMDAYGSIIALDSLQDGPPFAHSPPQPPAGLPGDCVAERAGAFFVCRADSALQIYARPGLPGLHPLRSSVDTPATGAPPDAETISGNALLQIEAIRGALVIRDAYTRRTLERREVWRHSEDTTVRGIESNRDGSEIAVHLTTSFDFPQPAQRNWRVIYKPAETLIETETAAPPPLPRLWQQELSIPERALRVAVADGALLISSTRAAAAPAVAVAPSEIAATAQSVTGLSLLESNRHILLRCGAAVYLLDLYAVLHYGDLLDRIRHADRMIAEHGAAKLMHTTLLNDDLRALPEYLRASGSDDHFNYEMIDYYQDILDPRKLEPPAYPSILSLQAEYLAAHRAWLYAAKKLEQLGTIQERDHRAPRTNPLLYARYALLAGDEKSAARSCEQGLNTLFYDSSPYNRMIRWQLLKMLFDE